LACALTAAQAGRMKLPGWLTKAERLKHAGNLSCQCRDCLRNAGITPGVMKPAPTEPDPIERAMRRLRKDPEPER
jgi:hypothetical protein